MHSSLSVEKIGEGFPLVESGGWNGDTRQGGVKPSSELLMW